VTTLNYTTTVPVTRTLAEIQDLLAAHGADQITTRFTATSGPTGMSFTLTGPHGPRAFTLPIDVDAVHRLLATDAAAEDIRRRLRKNPTQYQTREHAAQVAWRTAKDWVEAQLAIVQAQMATPWTR
jgi:hypothetical protein